MACIEKSFACVPLCVILSGIFGWIWLCFLTTPEPDITAHYALGVWSICISCILEMCVESFYLVSLAFLFVKLRVLLDMFHVIVRTITFTFLVLWNPSAAVVAFSVAQLLAVGVYCLSYCLYFKYYMKNGKMSDDFPFRSLNDFLPKRLEGQPSVDFRLCILTWSFLKQGILKQVLTDGERYIMTFFSLLSFYEQGIYDVVNNLGSLAARFLFRPIEESCYFYFSQLIHRDVPIMEQNKEQMLEAAKVLEQLLKCVTSFGIIVFVFGQSYSSLFLSLYGGRSLANDLGTLLLRTHCFSVLLLALNGITECYAQATMTAVQIDKYNYIMAFLSAGFLTMSWIFTYFFGSVGFILANCCNMSARIFNSIMYIYKKYEKTDYKPLTGFMPSKFFLSMVFVCGVFTKISERRFYRDSVFIHFFIGAICFFLTSAVWFYEESSWVFQSYHRIRRQSLKIE